MTIADNIRQEGIEQGIQQGIMTGIEQGMQTGIEQGIQRTAANMIRKGFDLDIISEITGMDKDYLLNIKARSD